jgi:hypothetical protein
MTIIPPPTLLLSVSPIQSKTERPLFDTIEVIETESQAALNTHTEHDFQVALKEMTEALGTVHTHGKRLLQG